MDKFIKNQSFADLITHPIKESTSISSSDANLFKPIIFQLFPNMTKIGISTRDSRVMPGHYPLNLTSLLSMLKSTSIPPSLRNIVIDECYLPHKRESGEWLAKAASPDLLQQYAESQFRVDLKIE